MQWFSFRIIYMMMIGILHNGITKSKIFKSISSKAKRKAATNICKFPF